MSQEAAAPPPTNDFKAPDKHAFAARQTCLCRPTNVHLPPDKHAFAARQICLCRPTNMPLPPDKHNCLSPDEDGPATLNLLRHALTADKKKNYLCHPTTVCLPPDKYAFVACQICVCHLTRSTNGFIYRQNCAYRPTPMYLQPVQNAPSPDNAARIIWAAKQKRHLPRHDNESIPTPPPLSLLLTRLRC